MQLMILHDNKNQDSLRLWHIPLFHSFLFPNNIPLCSYTTFMSWRMFRLLAFLIMVNEFALQLLGKFLHKQVF